MFIRIRDNNAAVCQNHAVVCSGQQERKRFLVSETCVMHSKHFSSHNQLLACAKMRHNCERHLASIFINLRIIQLTHYELYSRFGLTIPLRDSAGAWQNVSAYGVNYATTTESG